MSHSLHVHLSLYPFSKAIPRLTPRRIQHEHLILCGARFCLSGIAGCICIPQDSSEQQLEMPNWFLQAQN